MFHYYPCKMKVHFKSDSKQIQILHQSNFYYTLHYLYLWLTIIVWFTCNMNSQTVVQLSPRVNKEIQYSDLRYFGLFSTIDNGQSATITKTDSVYKVQITRPEMPDTTLVLTTPEFTELQQYVNTYESILYDDYVLHYKLIQPFTHYVQYSEPGENITLTTIDGEVHTKKLLYANDEYIVLKTTSGNIDINKAIGIQVLIFSYKEIATIGTNTFKYTGTLTGVSLAVIDYTITQSELNKLVHLHYNTSTQSQPLFKLAFGVISDILNKHTYQIDGNQSLYINAIETYRNSTLCPQPSAGIMPELHKELLLHITTSIGIDSDVTTNNKLQGFSFRIGSPISFISTLTDTVLVASDIQPRSSNPIMALNIFSGSVLFAINNKVQVGLGYSFFKEISAFGYTSDASISEYAECSNVNVLFEYCVLNRMQYQYQRLKYNIGLLLGLGTIGNIHTNVNFFDLGLLSSISFKPTPNLCLDIDCFVQRNYLAKTLYMFFDPYISNPQKYRTANNYIYGVYLKTGICF